MVIKCIDDKKIAEIEKFVREELLNHLIEQCKKNDSEFYDDEKVYIFGLYESKPETFKFLPGETILIEQIAIEVKNFVDRDGLNSHLDEFIPPKQFQVSRKDICQLFGCKLFGSNSRKRKNIEKSVNCLLDVKEHDVGPTVKSKQQCLKSEFVSKLKEQFEKKDPSLEGLDYISENMIEIKKNGKRIVAIVECIFCHAKNKRKKYITVQFDIAKNELPYWNFSNLKRHLKLHPTESLSLDYYQEEEQEEESVKSDQYLFDKHIDGQSTEKSSHQEIVDEHIDTEPSDLTIEGDIEGALITPGLSEEHINEQSTENSHQEINDYESSDFSVEVDIGDEDIIEIYEELDEESVLNISGASEEEIREYEIENIVDVNSVEYKIYHQISQQNLILTSAVHTNNEKTHFMKFNLGNVSKEISVLKIAGDGNCLFGSIANQLFNFKLNSSEHEDATSDLRENTVKFIQSNYKDFEIELKGRVLEEGEQKASKKGGNKRTRNKMYVTKKQSEKFLKDLRKHDTFGGAESFKAISQMHTVNILVFCELDVHYFPIGFNPNYDRTIFIAYRLAPNSNDVRNHYDSVAEVNMNILFDCVGVLLKNDSNNEKGAEKTIILE